MNGEFKNMREVYKQMWSQMYNIVLRTPIGPRYGTMEIHGDCGKVAGFLNVLMGQNRFQGVMDEENWCEISGQLKTLMRTVFYSAAGRINRDSLSLTMYTEKGVLEVTGTPQLREGKGCQ